MARPLGPHRRPEIVGVDRRVFIGLVALTLGATATGFIVAAGLDGSSRPSAIVAPDPAFSPEPIDNTPALPPVADPTVSVGPPSLPAPAPPPADVPTPLPPADPPVDDPDPPAKPPVPTPPKVPKPTAPKPPAPKATPKPPPPPPPRSRPTPSSDNDVFRPDPVPGALAEATIPAAELPADLARATAVLRTRAGAAGITAATKRDIAHVLALAQRYGTSPLPGRAATVARTVRANAWWYQRRGAPPDRVLLLDPTGLILSYRPGQGFSVNPVGTTGRWQKLNAAVPVTQLAETLLELGVRDVRGGRATMTWEYFDAVDGATNIRPGVSGMAQSRVSKLMASAYAATGDGRFAVAALQGTSSLAVPVNDGGARSMVAYPTDTAVSAWMVERAYPGADPWKGAALNGFMVSILELRSVEAVLSQTPTASASPDPTSATQGAQLARQLADEGAVTLEKYLPVHDSGKWSYYGLLTPGYTWRTFLANSSYHCYHVSLLRSLATTYADRSFGTTADKWQGYATRRGVRCSS